MIRHYTPADKPQLVTLFLLNTPAYFCPEEQADLEAFLDEEEADVYYVIEDDGTILACGGYAIENDEGWLCWYIVHPQHQGKGLGKQIVSKCLKEMRKLPGIEKLVVRTSQLVYPFYEKFGFKLLSTQDHYWGEGMHLYHMEMKMPAAPGI